MSGTNTAIAMPGFKPKSNQHQVGKKDSCCYFQMPLHYPRYKKADYKTMPEWKPDYLLKEYGLPAIGDVKQKRKFAMAAFLGLPRMKNSSNREDG